MTHLRGWQERHVSCIAPGGKAISDLHCIHKHKPNQRRRCTHRDCHVVWRTTTWSAVSMNHLHFAWGPCGVSGHKMCPHAWSTRKTSCWCETFVADRRLTKESACLLSNTLGRPTGIYNRPWYFVLGVLFPSLFLMSLCFFIHWYSFGKPHTKSFSFHCVVKIQGYTGWKFRIMQSRLATFVTEKFNGLVGYRDENV